MAAPPTRRSLLARGLRAGGLAVAAAGVPAAWPTAAGAQTGDDERILLELIRLEQQAVFVYEHATAELTGSLQDAAKLMRHQDAFHADRLIVALEGQGGRRPAKPSSVRDVDGLGAALAGGRTALLEFALALEERTVRAYYEAQSRLLDAKTLQVAATLMGSDGQHMVILRQALHRTPVPDALETGAA